MIEPRPEILNTPLAHHGAFDYDELTRLGLSPDDVIDFSVNSNPYGPPPGVREAIAAVPLDRYPDRECLALRQKLAAKQGYRLENIVVGNGTAELLLLIAQAFIRPGDAVVLGSPAFTEYRRVSRLMGGVIHTYPLHLLEHRVDEAHFEDRLRHLRPRVAFICQPDNPTGILWDYEMFNAIATRYPDTLFVVDEAYINFVYSEQHQGVGLESLFVEAMTLKNVVLLRSLTKDYALAGLRLGYALGHPDIIEAVRRVRPAWNVNALAQAAGLAVLDQAAWLRDCTVVLQADKTRLIAGLKEHGLEALPSATHYFLVDVGNGAAFRTKLLRHQVMVRDCGSFGLPQYVRIATRTPEDNAKLLDAVSKSHP